MKKDFWQGLFIWFCCLVLDQVLKSQFVSSAHARFNEGFILGSFSHMPVGIRILTMSSLYGFIFFVYFSLIYFLSSKLKWLKFGLSFLAGGIGGNVIDRTLKGMTLDFIPFPSAHSPLFIFNLADVFQSTGAILVLYILIFKTSSIWPKDDQRGRYVVNPKEQMRFAFKMAIFAMSSSLVVGIFSYAYWRISTIGLALNQDEYLFHYLIIFISLSLTFCLFSFIVGVIISHKTVGPLYAFELYVEDLLNGEDRPLQLREGDHYKHLEKIAENLRSAMKK